VSESGKSNRRPETGDRKPETGDLSGSGRCPVSGLRSPVSGLPFLLLLLACHRGAAATDDDEREAPAAPVKVTCASPAPLQLSDSITVRGVVSAPPDRQATVAPAVAGRLAQVLVRDGQKVQKGDVLAIVDDPALEAAMGEAEAQVATAQSAADVAAKAAARARRLVDEGIAARRDIEEADAKAAAAAGDLRAARARRELAATQRERARVRSPIAGTVVRLLKHAGELVDGTPATPLAEVADPAELELRGDAAAADLVRLAEGQPAEVRLDALPDTPFPAKVLFVAPAIDPAGAVGWVRFSLAPGDAVHPRLGLAGQARVALTVRTALTVPATALRRGAGGETEVVVCAGDKAKVAPVKVGATQGDKAEIVSGITAADRVVVDHALNLQDGAAITP
jgi:membrane fusion protein, heavy metal efflux system